MCQTCKTIFAPEWFKKHDVPLSPVKPKFETKGVPYTGDKRWVLQRVTQKCPKCRACVTIHLPLNKLRKKGFLFGDDAKREHEGRKVYIYSLVGADQKVLPDFERKYRALKQRLLPTVPPESWKLHMTKLWSGTVRAGHPDYKTLSFEDVMWFIEELAALIKNSNLFVYNIALTNCHDNPPYSANKEGLRDDAYILLVFNVIDEWTDKNAQPNIFFDSEKRTHASEVIHGWARDAFVGSTHSLLYGFLSRGIEIPEPKFVSPASYPGLEIADFVSFAVGRFYDRMWKEKDVEIDPRRLGLVTYMGFDCNGDLLWRRQKGYPWEQFCR